MKIVLIGAGSRSFGLVQIVDILRCREFAGRGVTLSLVDENGEALALMSRVAERVKSASGTDIALESTTDRRTALPGADYVIISVARRRMELWEQDFRIPIAFGFKHVLGENGGPGALFHALRSFEIVIPICRDVEALCPKALVLNFTNPEARVLHAINHLTSAKAFGFCHGVFSALSKITEYTGRAADDLEVVSAGLNHFYSILSCRDKKTGADLLPGILASAAADESTGPLFSAFARIYDVFTYPSDDHCGEYVAFGAEYRLPLWKYGREFTHHTPGRGAPAIDSLLDYAEGRIPANDPRFTAQSEELTVPVICDIEYDRGTLRPAVNVLNREGFIANLPRDVVVEVPVRADAAGIHPVAVGNIPEPFAAFARTQYAIHGLLTEAYRTGSRRTLLQALLLDPCTHSIPAAEKLLDRMLTLQAEYLPTFG